MTGTILGCPNILKYSSEVKDGSGPILLEHLRWGREAGNSTAVLSVLWGEGIPGGSFERTKEGVHSPRRSKEFPGEDEAPPGRVHMSQAKKQKIFQATRRNRMDHREHRTNVSGPRGLEHSVGEIKRGQGWGWKHRRQVTSLTGKLLSCLKQHLPAYSLEEQVFWDAGRGKGSMVK